MSEENTSNENERKLIEKHPELKNTKELTEILEKLKQSKNIEKLISGVLKKIKTIELLEDDYTRTQKMDEIVRNLMLKLKKFEAKLAAKDGIPTILKVAQNQTTNALKGAFPNIAKNRIVKDNNYIQSIQANHYTIEYKTLKGEKKNYKTKIAINDLPNVKLAMNNVMFYKFFTFIHYQFNRQGTYLFSFNSREFIEFLGKEATPKIVEKTNAKINKFCKNILPYIKLKWWRGNTESKTITPFAGTEIKRSIVSISLEVSYAESIRNSYYELPIEAGKLGENAYLIADYIFTYARECKKDNPTLTYGTLYKKTGLPSYEEVQAGSYERNTNKAIKEPIYKALKEIQETLNNKLEMEFSEINSEKWEDFIKGKVFIKILDYNEQCKAITKLQDKKIKQAIKNKKDTQK